jgi:hypothetical protein
MDKILELVINLSDSEWQNIVDARRFWLQVDRKSDNDACWDWLGCKDIKTGYGVGRLNKKTNHAHRIAYLLTTKETLNSLIVIRHKCDRKICCNPNHLEKGTNAQNVQDWQTRLIDQKGEHNFSSKLTEVDVEKIRFRALEGEEQKKLAKDFNVSGGTISMIITGKTWKHSYNKERVK